MEKSKKEKEEKMSKPNYIVHINKNGKDYKCYTPTEVWKAISKQGWSGYKVWSPIGLDTNEFIPF